MNEQWEELKETITELRDNDGTGTQQEVCKFLANYMDILEKQMQESSGDAISRQAVLDIVDSYSESRSNVEDVAQDIISNIMALPTVNSQEPKTGHWSHDGSHWKNRFICSECGYKLFDEPTNYCPNCGCRMVEPQERSDKCSKCEYYTNPDYARCKECGAESEEV